MNRVIHFEIPANEPNKVVEFYKKVFGWQIQLWGNEEYWLAFTGDKNTPGINGAFFIPKDIIHGDGFVNSIQVENIDEAIEKIRSSGGQIVVEKRTIPGLGYQSYARDIEGTLFGLMQDDPKAI